MSINPDLINNTIFYDFTTPLSLLNECPKFVLTQSQFEDIVYYIFENMQIDLTQVIKSTVEWQEDDLLKSSNFDSVSKETIEDIKIVMFDVAIDLYYKFLNMDFFDRYNVGASSFPIVLNGIVGYNVVLIKDNVISSNVINVYGN